MPKQTLTNETRETLIAYFVGTRGIYIYEYRYVFVLSYVQFNCEYNNILYLDKDVCIPLY